MSAADLALPPPAEGSAEVAARVAAARNVQARRYGGHTNGSAENGNGVLTNAEADGELLEAVAAPGADGKALLTEAADKLRLSARGWHRVLRVARTIADLDAGGSDAAGPVRRLHVAEALSYRRLSPGR